MLKGKSLQEKPFKSFIGVKQKRKTKTKMKAKANSELAPCGSLEKPSSVNILISPLIKILGGDAHLPNPLLYRKNWTSTYFGQKAYLHSCWPDYTDINSGHSCSPEVEPFRF